FTDTDGSSPDGWRYFEEVVFGGKEAGPESYR
ncbi:short-chain dehydrogenase, partial [Streptomyces albidoflavus]